jgi:mRNA interferase RelE/StbE
MRGIVLHRRAAKYLRRMPKPRQIEIRDVLREVAGLDDIGTHSGMRPMSGDMRGWFRLRVGVYRAILKLSVIESAEVLFVAYIGPRGDAY